jgi:GT2 family glycosyltransferase
MTLDVLIPTYARPIALAVTLTSLALATLPDFRVVVSDQNDDMDMAAIPEIHAVMRVLRLHGHSIEIHKHVPRRGMAEQRQFLLDHSWEPYALFLDDDLIVEPDVPHRMLCAIQGQQCGFVGCPVIGLSYACDVRTDEQQIEFWEGRVEPESVRPGSAAWERYRLHNAANPLHVQRRLGLTRERQRLYRVAWVGGCVLYDVAKLRAAGGFSFWPELPVEHAGEDVLAQLRVMERFGGCGLLPSGVYHQELPTTIPDRMVDAPLVLR